LRRLRLIETWDDRQIRAGENFGEEINENIERADIIILLVSAYFIDSDYCYKKELARALARHKKREARVIPVIVRDANWKAIPRLKGLEALPKNGKPVTNWPKLHSAWRDVSERVQEMIEDMRDADGTH
jgi:internalin A